MKIQELNVATMLHLRGMQVIDSTSVSTVWIGSTSTSS